jgi:hypothetical protein
LVQWWAHHWWKEPCPLEWDLQVSRVWWPRHHGPPAQGHGEGYMH